MLADQDRVIGWTGPQQLLLLCRRTRRKAEERCDDPNGEHCDMRRAIGGATGSSSMEKALHRYRPFAGQTNVSRRAAAA
jgi:hypothetical protein